MAGGELDLELLRGLPFETQTVRLRTPRGSNDRVFRGPTLHDYARKAMLLAAHPADRFTACYVLATAVDGARVTVAFPEFTPAATDKRVMLAFEQDGEPIRAGIRLVVPGDDLGGRSVAGVVALETREVPQGDARPVGALEVTGLVERPGPLDSAAVSAGADEAAIEEQRVHGHDNPPRHYQGARLWGLLDATGIVVNPDINEDILSKVVVVWSADGTPAVIALGEIEPRFMDGNVIVADRRDGAPLPDGEGPFRLVVPDQRNPGRWMKQLVRIEVREG